jgi:hypothetical protein
VQPEAPFQWEVGGLVEDVAVGQVGSHVEAGRNLVSAETEEVAYMGKLVRPEAD